MEVATLLSEYALYFLVCLVLVGLIRWGYELLFSSGEEPHEKGSAVKTNGAGSAGYPQDRAAHAAGAPGPDAGAGAIQRQSTASSFHEPAGGEDGSMRSTAVCGLMPSGSSAMVMSVEQFGASLQRMIRACHDMHGSGSLGLRIFDDHTVSDQMHGTAVRLTECRATQFQRLRAAAGLSEDGYCQSMCAKPYSGGKVEASGKSGSFFLRTHDNKFVLKTIEDHEFEVLKDILPHMVLYLQEHHRSLLCRFLGSYSLQIGDRTLRFVVMANCLPRHADAVYDLKGTTEDRWVDPATCGVMKDNNFAPHRILLTANLCEELTKQICDDAEFLHSLGVMDYSLLVGMSQPVGQVVDEPGLALVEGWLASAGGKPAAAAAAATPHAFQLGIIDYLQRWTPKKVAAHWLKKSTLGCFHEIDTEPPAVYCKRFYKYFFEKIQIMQR